MCVKLMEFWIKLNWRDDFVDIMVTQLQIQIIKNLQNYFELNLKYCCWIWNKNINLDTMNNKLIVVETRFENCFTFLISIQASGWQLQETKILKLNVSETNVFSVKLKFLHFLNFVDLRLLRRSEDSIYRRLCKQF